MAPTISRELFVTLLELTEKPDDPRARALRSSLDCVSVSGLLLRLVKADETESRLLLPRERCGGAPT